MPEVLKIETTDAESIKRVVDILKKGKIVAFPTETVYGLACDFYNEEAKEKLRKIKHRPSEKPFVLAVWDKSLIEQFIFPLPLGGYKLIEGFLPGPLTLVFNTLEGKDYAFRIPQNPAVLEILEKFRGPVCLTSANLSGRDTFKTPQEIVDEFKDVVELVVDTNSLGYERPSTVCKVNTNGDCKILREGPVTLQDIEGVLKTLNILFVCTGNSCRSVIAEHLFRKYSQDRGRFRVSSCGLYAPQGLSASEETIKLLRQEYIDVKGHLSRDCKPDIFKIEDYIFVMERRQKERIISEYFYLRGRVYQLSEFAEGKEQDIDDPISKPLEVYERVFSQIKDYVLKVIDKLSNT